MSRIDVQTLVLAMESRIQALNQNPPELVPASTIKLMLEQALEEEIKRNFAIVIKLDAQKALKEQFKKEKNKLVKSIVKELLADTNLKADLMKAIKDRMVDSLD